MYELCKLKAQGWGHSSSVFARSVVLANGIEYARLKWVVFGLAHIAVRQANDTCSVVKDPALDSRFSENNMLKLVVF